MKVFYKYKDGSSYLQRRAVACGIDDKKVNTSTRADKDGLKIVETFTIPIDMLDHVIVYRSHGKIDVYRYGTRLPDLSVLTA